MRNTLAVKAMRDSSLVSTVWRVHLKWVLGDWPPYLIWGRTWTNRQVRVNAAFGRARHFLSRYHSWKRPYQEPFRGTSASNLLETELEQIRYAGDTIITLVFVTATAGRQQVGGRNQPFPAFWVHLFIILMRSLYSSWAFSTQLQVYNTAGTSSSP